ncbi:two-component sensor histidine kinase [Altererythrobacter xixiisoli]|uniref:histidine kinase n=2 Tax=Croceibacterium xixiisoli TaxID=1476466 RepID=A0A6I4TTI3_9SPHN|nr:two-component sensor histidine kinase [Croceibacterium xixiisoli]
MLLSVALALLVAQTLSVVLQYRAAEQRRDLQAANGLAFQLVADPRIDYRQRDSRFPGDESKRRWLRLRVERTPVSPVRAGEKRDTKREETLRAVLLEQGIDPVDLVVIKRMASADSYVQGRLRERRLWRDPPEWANGPMLVAGLRRAGETGFSVARVPLESSQPRHLGSLLIQTLLLYIVLVGGLALLLRRITRPIAALTRRLETFAETRATEGQLEPEGPEDTRRLIVAHNAMEGRIAALINEKDVMLGAIGHDLKTPLAALRVRIESVEDPIERDRMAGTIENITRTLDDILSLARIGRPTGTLERTDLAALVASVIEEYEDMGKPVELGDTPRMALALRATSLRRAIRNLVENALRYAGSARISLAREGDMAVIKVEDDGCGIADDDIAAMFEPFARGEASRNRETGGAGLGLTLARAIAEQHGGTLVLANRRTADGTVQGLLAEIRLPLE